MSIQVSEADRVKSFHDLADVWVVQYIDEDGNKGRPFCVESKAIEVVAPPRPPGMVLVRVNSRTHWVVAIDKHSWRAIDGNQFGTNYVFTADELTVVENAYNDPELAARIRAAEAQKG